MAKDAESSKKKRPYGEGSVFMRKDGTWVGVSRYIDPETGEQKKHYVYAKGQKEVAGKKRNFEDELKKGILPNKGKMTVSEWLDTWLETYAKTRVRQNTFEDYQRLVDAHLKPSIGSNSLKDLRPQQVQKMINDKLASGRIRTDSHGKKGGPLAPRTVKYIHIVLHMALEQAVKNSLVIRNVCDAVDKPQKIKHEFMPWSTEQTNMFLTSVKNTSLFPVYMVAWGAGLRRSEILGLEWPDIDVKKGTLTVRRTLVRVKGGYKFGEPKTQKSRRTIPLPEPVIKALKEWKRELAKFEMEWNGQHINVDPKERPKFNPLNMVFCNEIGEPLNPDEISRAFKKDLENAKLPNIRFHDLRHGHATMLLELGEDIKLISDRLGHSSIAITGDIYAHVTDKMQREAVNKLEKALNLNQ
ncbi:MAG: site-specific integrase [Syntrophomonadaceae bacterium]|nr:site-specific integrase [Syntrophomonadaceae bacterium]